MYKLIFYVPINDVETVKNAVFKAGGGRLGNYSHCSWQTNGVGQFKPLLGSNPTIEIENSIQKIEELRVEILCEASIIKDAVFALKLSHSYEEPAYEIISIQNNKF